MAKPGTGCEVCERASNVGWWGDGTITHCRDCHRSWSRTSREAHCSICHRHFSSPTNFDHHFGPRDEHRDPVKTGQVFRQRDDGAWYKEDPRYLAGEALLRHELDVRSKDPQEALPARSG